MILDEKVIMYPPPPYLGASTSSPSPLSQGHSQLYAHTRGSPTASSYGSTLTLSLPTQTKPTLAVLPAHILLQVIHHTFPHSKPELPAYQADDSDADYTYVRGYITRDSIAERQRRTLLWLSTNLRLVSRTLYTACMHVLRSTYLPAYLTLVRPPYTSDPFPMGAPVTAASLAPGSPAPSADSTSGPPAYAASTHSRTQSHGPEAASPLSSPQRETAVLDRFILLKIRHDILMDESSLHLDREDAFRDLFDVAQPRARMEDLVRDLGVRRGVVFLPEWVNRRLGLGSTVNGSSSSLQLVRELDEQIEARAAATRARAQPQATAKKSFFSFKKSGPSSPPNTESPSPTFLPSIQPLPFPALSVTFQPRRIGLVLARTRTIVEVPRAPGRRETLESLTGALVNLLVHEIGSG